MQLRKKAPLALSLLFLWAVSLALYMRCIARTGGLFVYPLDDPYIHMAVAKNLAFRGVWGVNPDEFASASSSPLWTLLIAFLFRVFGTHDLIPLFLNLFFGSLLVLVSYRVLSKVATSAIFLVCSLLAFIVLVPVPILMLSGLEHVLHSLLIVAYAYLFSHALVTEDRSLRARTVMLAPFLMATRYESAAILLVSSLIALSKRKTARFGLAILLATAAFPFAFGLISWHYGWHFLPNSLLIKVNTGLFPLRLQGSLWGTLLGVAKKMFDRLYSVPHLLVLLVLSASLLFSRTILNAREREPRTEPLLHLLFLLSAIGHVAFGGFGWFFRYEAYLIALGLLVVAYEFAAIYRFRERCALVFPSAASKLLTVTLVLLMLSTPLVLRSRRAWRVAPIASQNIYEQQYQMARFVREYYSGRSIVANDIGALSYYGRVRIIDSVGLGTSRIAQLRTLGSFSTSELDRIARKAGAPLAITYYNMPDSWIRVGEWTIKNNVVCGHETVFFYASDKYEARVLRRNLTSFSPRLPRGVTSRIY